MLEEIIFLKIRFYMSDIKNINEINISTKQLVLNFIQDSNHLTQTTKSNVSNWLHESFSKLFENGENAHSIILRLLKSNNWKEIEDRFFEQIQPGTAGIRGKLGIGSTRINEATVGVFAQAHANYISKNPIAGREGIIIGGDSRTGSYDPLIKGPGYLQKMVAEIYAAKGIPVYLSDKPLPTPLVSFAIGEMLFNGKLPVSGAINTASHNPSEDNGFKIYESSGHQVVSEDFKKGLQFELNRIENFSMVNTAKLKSRWPKTEDELNNAIKKNGKIIIETDNAPINIIDSTGIIESYCSKIKRVRILINKNFSKNNNEFHFHEKILDSILNQKIVITTLSGNGWNSIKKLLESQGLVYNKHFYAVESEIVPDGSFPTGYGKVQGKPNPEYKENFYKAIKLAGEINAKYVIACDPDSDRVGIGIVDNSYKDFNRIYENARFFNGNEQLCLAVFFLGIFNKYNENDIFIQTLVSSRLYSKIVEYIGGKLSFVPVGFKYFGQISDFYVNNLMRKINNFTRIDYSKLTFEERTKLYKSHDCPRFIHGGEESMGQNMYDFVFDKDTPASIALFCEIIGFLGLKNDDKISLLKDLSPHYNSDNKLITVAASSENLLDALNNIYCEFGEYKEEVFSFRFEGQEGNVKKNKVMNYFRTLSLKNFNSNQDIDGSKVIAKCDFLNSDKRGRFVVDADDNIIQINAGVNHTINSKGETIHIPPYSIYWLPEQELHELDSSDYLVFYMDNGNEIHIRPSGTEPVIKLYINFHDKSFNQNNKNSSINQKISNTYISFDRIIKNIIQ
ncbi:MAG: hypothetical protein ACD_79C00972G0002 [uncultured bacterium]|nr:MAG: hypothetical protein ACD_79C00972G0002 [uncultured bacterium]